ncbi:MAG: hypothetical protein UU64_C0019G0009 [candidate division WWE3 bacterium GW2011_GWF2_41_45]|uniref:Uncharacterized protein n=2 Tax=Katanobacteria TaxID=422282 RepID=A0A1F4W2T9_UNCKA|nr:MAG: hypothetical protein UU55_C0005G0071 [candidate division WWE3 bacterium GW2011_GWC2_41_23]KKS08924.1 MAG: hypothetical protein UU64_C0019G0009 [candidate division WWE3 bacterium GW2011_GWF2_41_45]KKS11828.1 MAG: hypothetical protein UU68_C0010G0009 [candidate division WWE3 bacterium GW2011_GWF1_41_53]KKS19512.1 MAG: hypothetical protein UU79_C0017G0015 [candidate division WWE3 bacterium GW2011_GWE1_41_72]KKS25927.1 MAG: hypothetical protein UU86_C0046G0019 [candidate division WWE3 bacte
MSTKKIILITLLVVIAVVLFPEKYTNTKFNKTCKDYCESEQSSGLQGGLQDLNCTLPEGGVVEGCLGISADFQCKSTMKCFLRCNSICFGHSYKTGDTRGFLEKKLDAIKNIF